MKTRNTLFTLLVTAFFLLSGSNLFAQEPVAAPEVKSQGSVSYISAGITVDERDAMKPLAKNYNLRMAFALNVGNYVADVKVKVLNSKGKTVFDVVSDGPWLYVMLPAGKYKVTAEYEGKSITKTATLAAKKGASLNFIWPGVKEKYEN